MSGAKSYIDRYLSSLGTQRQLSSHTISSYRLDLMELDSLRCKLGSHVGWDSITHAHIRAFAARLHARELNPRSIGRKLSAWRSFFNWLSEEIELAANPVDGIRPPKKGKPLPKALTVDHAVQLVSACPPEPASSPVTQQCNRAMFELLYSCGLRISELISLDVAYIREPGYHSVSWIDLEAAELTVSGKGKRIRSVPVGKPALQAVRDWLAVRQSLVAFALDPHALFVTGRGTRMSARLVQMRLKAHALAIGIPADVHPHMLRHSFASHVLQSSGDLRAVQELLGHTSIAATQIYTSLDFQRLAQVYDGAHPRAKRRTGE